MIFLNITFISVSALILLFMTYSLKHESWLTVSCNPCKSFDIGQEEFVRAFSKLALWSIKYRGSD